MTAVIIILVVILLWLLLPVYLCAREMNKKGRSVALGVLAGLFLGWIGYIITLVLSDLRGDATGAPSGHLPTQVHTPEPPVEAASNNLLIAVRVRKEFGGLVAVNDVDFTIPPQSIVSLIGPNGAGKTTFFNMLTGVYTPTAGRIVFDGDDVTNKPPHAITQLGVGRTFQNIRLFEQMTALENVLVGMHCRLKGGILGSIVGTPRVRREERRAAERARELLNFSGLKGRDDQLASNLPYGDQRRLEVARALATEPKLLLLDEPTAGMNPNETASFTGFVSLLREQENLTVLMIEHDMKVVMNISDRVTVLDYGEKIAEGSPSEVQKDERVIEAYLGRAATE